MKLEFCTCHADVTASWASIATSRRHEIWREGEATVAWVCRGPMQVMLDLDDQASAGPLFTVDSVLDFHATRADALVVVNEPSAIPGGFMATYRDAGGATIYLLDQSTADAG